jgi:hypothetical protein
MNESMYGRMDEDIGGGMKDRWTGVKTDGWMDGGTNKGRIDF